MEDKVTSTSAGLKFDDGKERFDLIAPEFLFAVARVLKFGAAKYADRNWENGIHYSRCFGAMMRHMWAWWGSQQPTSHNFLFGDLDQETSFSHLHHAGCCLMFLIAYEDRGMRNYDDRPTGPVDSASKQATTASWTEERRRG